MAKCNNLRRWALKCLKQNLRMVDNNDGPSLRSLWSKVYKILRHHRGFLAISNAVPQMSIS